MAEVTGLFEWEADLMTAATKAPLEVRQVLSKGALNIKTDWRRRWSGHPHIPALPRAVTYELKGGPLSPSAEIGVDKALPQGPLGNIIEYGTRNNGPIPGGLPALDAEEPRFLEALADLSVKLLDG